MIMRGANRQDKLQTMAFSRLFRFSFIALVSISWTSIAHATSICSSAAWPARKEAPVLSALIGDLHIEHFDHFTRPDKHFKSGVSKLSGVIIGCANVQRTPFVSTRVRRFEISRQDGAVFRLNRRKTLRILTAFCDHYGKVLALAPADMDMFLKRTDRLQLDRTCS
jgi:hypothetical protein